MYKVVIGKYEQVFYISSLLANISFPPLFLRLHCNRFFPTSWCIFFITPAEKSLGWSWQHYSTMMCGAERRTAIVVMMVKVVKVIRQNLNI